ncbi:hypothetical protein GWI33_005360 [Rhynchophorus ferrugineus]|uniref:Uncharacterized protein n=1 Tax=Rhynchophorus ferrugineus TaxID=354439 RepID=A0A834ISS8_RHYFE|nr:hypothetical protein GWI33_005360 [Rhynchophorus ferrugineus]
MFFLAIITGDKSTQQTAGTRQTTRKIRNKTQLISRNSSAEASSLCRSVGACETRVFDRRHLPAKVEEKGKEKKMTRTENRRVLQVVKPFKMIRKRSAEGDTDQGVFSRLFSKFFEGGTIWPRHERPQKSIEDINRIGEDDAAAEDDFLPSFLDLGQIIEPALDRDRDCSGRITISRYLSDKLSPKKTLYELNCTAYID